MPSDDVLWPKGYIPKPGNFAWPEGYVPKQQSAYKDPITAASEKVAPLVGRTLAEAPPFIGSIVGAAGGPLGSAAGTAAGTMLTQLLKSARPDLLGEAPQGLGESVGDLGKELVTNNLLPAGINKGVEIASQVGKQGLKAATGLALKNFPAVREAVVKNLTGQLMKRSYPVSGIIEQGAENAATNFADNPMPFSRNAVGLKLLNLGDEYSHLATDPVRTQTYKDIANQTLSDIIHVQNAKLAAGPEFTKDLAMNKLLTGGFSGAEGSLDATRVLKELGGKNSEIYKEAIPERTLDSVKKVLSVIQDQEKGHGVMDSVVRWSGTHLLWVAGGLGMHSGTIGTVGGAAAGVRLTNAALRKLMSNPVTADIVAKAMTTSEKAPEAKFLNQALSRVIQAGADVAATPDR